MKIRQLGPPLPACMFTLTALAAFVVSAPVAAWGGSCTPKGAGSAPLTKAIKPSGIEVDAAGKVFFTHGEISTVYVLDNGRLKVVANAKSGLSSPGGLSMAPGEALYIADPGKLKIFEVGSDCKVTTVAGGGNPEDNIGNGLPATQARLYSPIGVAADVLGNFYIDEYNTNTIRQVTSDDIIHHLTGGNLSTYCMGVVYEDPVPVGQGCLAGAYDVAVNKSGTKLYISDHGTCQVKMVDVQDGTIVTLVGGKGLPDYPNPCGWDGDGGLATEAHIHYSGGLAVDLDGNLFIADTYNHVIRKVDSATGIISTVAGVFNPQLRPHYNGDGLAANSAQLANPTDVAVDEAGNIYIADNGNGLIRKVDVNDNVMHNIAGIAPNPY